VPNPPTGTVTFLFTDIEGSTKLWERSPEAMSEALARHDKILRETIEIHGGHVFKTVGDAFFAAFSTATDALEAGLESQRKLFSSEWGQTGPLRVRMALHTGAAEERDGDYFGPPLNRVARLLSAAYGGQVLLSLTTQELVGDQLPADVELQDLGEYRLKDLGRPEHVFQLATSGLNADFPSLHTLDVHPNNLPMQSTPLVGREREVREVAERVRSEEVRLLTLTGPGGTGKTRLGLQAAADLLEEFSDGAFFVALATITEPELVASTIARVLGVKESAEQSLMESLKNYLRDKHLLLVLDNFEQVLEGTSLIGELLGACPNLKVLATSRIPLKLYGEQEYLVPPLSLPDPRVMLPLEVLTQYEAVKLFVERAKAAKAGFEVTDENAPAVAEICARLDGLPLAIELAAARVKVLTPQKMLDRLSDPLKLLTKGARDLPERQRTLRATMEWSHALLEVGEKALFARLSVFAGGCTLEAIEVVCGAAEGDSRVEVLDGVESLVDKSLLKEEVVGAEPRFVMLETVHQYAREKLEEIGEAEELRRLHAQYFLSLAEEELGTFEGGGRPEWFQLLEDEQDNFRVALSWSLESDEVEFGLQLAAALQPFWARRGHYGEGRRWLEEVLAKDGPASVVARAKAQNAIGWLAQWQGDVERASIAAKEGLELRPQVGKESSVAVRLQLLLGFTAEEWADYERAIELFEDILELSRKAGDGWATAATLLHLGNVEGEQGNHEQAVKLYKKSIALCRKLDYPVLQADILVNLGYTRLLQGNYEQATALSKEAIALYQEQGYRHARFEYPVDNLGWAALGRGDVEEAEVKYLESLMLCRELGNKLVAAESLQGLACVAGKREDMERSARLFGAAEALFRARNISHDLPEEQELRESYPEAALEQNSAAWEEGSKLTFEEAIEYALSGNQSPPPAHPALEQPSTRE
jgi:predicted ATPase/class 3 adenylate cyclase/Tfp pilus assembly protein PilF